MAAVFIQSIEGVVEMRNIITIIVATGLVLCSTYTEAKETRGNESRTTVSPNMVCPEVPLAQSAMLTPLLVDECGGGGDPGGGGNPPPPFSPPAMSFPLQMLPGVLVNPLPYQSCKQFPHVFTAFSNDVPQGTTLYLSGIVAPNTFAIFGFYNQFGQLAKVQMTNNAKSNCVIHHDENPFSTSDLTPGYYTVYANYVTISPPGALPIFGGSFPPGFNFDVTVNGYQNSVSMRYVSTIRIR
jgi:hypothetical protein